MARRRNHGDTTRAHMRRSDVTSQSTVQPCHESMDRRQKRARGRPGAALLQHLRRSASRPSLPLHAADYRAPNYSILLNKSACELAAVTPPASPFVTERWEMSPNRSEAPLTLSHRRCMLLTLTIKSFGFQLGVYSLLVSFGASQSVSQAVSSNTSILDWFVDEATTARAL